MVNINESTFSKHSLRFVRAIKVDICIILVRKKSQYHCILLKIASCYEILIKFSQNLSYRDWFFLRTMEFPHLGKHCSEKSCHKLGIIARHVIFVQISTE